jgi:hypothetical protein
MILRARISELTGAKNARQIYDDTLNAAKIENHLLVQALSYAWFGAYLIRAGFGRRGDYLNIGYKIASEKNLAGLTKYIEKVMAKCNVEIEGPREEARDAAAKAVAIVNPWPEMVMQHMDFCISALNSDGDLVSDARESILMFKSVYPDAPAVLYVLDANKVERVLYSDYNIPQTDGVLRSVAPYLTIRSTLILHVNANPAHTAIDAGSGVVSEGNLVETLRYGDGEDLGATQVFEDIGGLETASDASMQRSYSGSASTINGSVNSGLDGMQALVGWGESTVT